MQTQSGRGVNIQLNRLAALSACFFAVAVGANESPLLPTPASAPVSSGAAARYAQECGGCHMPFPAEFLPERSWRKLMNGLQNHFGDNAELAPEDAGVVLEYLVKNSSDHTWSRRRTITRDLPPNETPLRISELPYFIGRHRTVPRKVVVGNPDIRNFSRCPACHTRAEAGSFHDREIKIPGYDWQEDELD
jgi:Dihaem cytochrome c